MTTPTETKGAKLVQTAKKVTDITERTEEFSDFENNEVKVIILDGETGKVSLVHIPFHGRVVIDAIKGNVRKVRFEDEYLI